MHTTAIQDGRRNPFEWVGGGLLGLGLEDLWIMWKAGFLECQAGCQVSAEAGRECSEYG